MKKNQTGEGNITLSLRVDKVVPGKDVLKGCASSMR